ncbi:tyrosine-type recombinase/integrase [Aureimonas altamirensis]|uniref:tyrosine-type recombinase/integrase n=1 Tax=Aureimonas altamirensis TaxID=370622 RepID=UPI001E319A2C|nr:site-specific integrase [Aureimonas altamirensis]UHD43843.1 tyrosine-type recombinase/integrase [Aureimonas altamirensis]
MPKIALTDAFVRGSKSVTGDLVEWSDARERGLSLRVTAAGVKSWTFRYHDFSGKRKRISLGRADDLSLANARAAAAAERTKVHAGIDPSAQRKSQKAKATATRFDTVEGVGKLYFEAAATGRHKPNGRPKKDATIKDERRYFDLHIVKEFGREKLADLTRDRIQAFVDKLAEKRSSGAARQSRIVLQGIYSFALWREIVSADPCKFVTSPRYEQRERVLSDAELKIIWNALSGAHELEDVTISRKVSLSVLIAAVTLQRRGEVTGMMRDELDFNAKTWTIPSSRTKNRRTHVVPLSNLATKLIMEAVALAEGHAEVFPSPQESAGSIQPAAMSHAFRRLAKHLKVTGVRPHDLRRTGATNLTSERIGTSRFIVSQVLNHTSDTGGTAAITAVYDRNAYLPEKRRALESWSDLLGQIVADGVEL